MMMRENEKLDRELRAAAIRHDLADSESLPKEKEYQAEQKTWWNRIMRRIRPQHAEWTRQDALYNIDHSPELGLPLGALEAVDDAEKTARILATEELKALGVSAEIAAKAQPILEQVGVESFNNYTQYDPEKDSGYFYYFLRQEKKKLAKKEGRKLFMDELVQLGRASQADWDQRAVDDKMPFVREWAIENASQAGIDRAPDLVEVITGKAKTPQELLATLSLADLIAQVKSNLPSMVAAEATNDNTIKAMVLDLAHDRSNWLEQEEAAIIEKILETETTRSPDHDKDVQALMIVTMGIHLSWSAFQGPRSVVDQKELFDQAQKDKEVMTGQELVKRYSNLRVTRPINRTFAEMQVNKFREGFGKHQDYTKGMALAIFEILKDLVNIGLPDGSVS